MVLGVRFDRTLSFTAHADYLKVKTRPKIRALGALAGKSWGCNKESTLQLTNAYIIPSILYAAAAWLPSTAKTNVAKLEVIQNQAARIVTGCHRSTPIEAVGYEKSRRLPANNPRRELAERADPPQRLVSQPSWRPAGREISARAGLADLRIEHLHPVPYRAPWRNSGTPSFAPSIPGTDKSVPPDDRAAAARTALDQLPPADFVLWTDGSAEQAVINGGSGGILTDGAGTELRSFYVAAGRFCLGYRAEMVAILER